MSIKKEFKELLKSVEQQGGKIKPTKKGYQVMAPNGEDIVTLHGTPGDWRRLQTPSRSCGRWDSPGRAVR